jgi:hypothetical protein
MASSSITSSLLVVSTAWARARDVASEVAAAHGPLVVLLGQVGAVLR